MQTLLLNLLLSLCFLWVSLSGRVIRYSNIPSENNVEDEEISDENIDKVYSNFVSSSGLNHLQQKRNYYRKYNLSDLDRSMNDNNKQNDTNPTIRQLSNNDALFESKGEYNNTRDLNPSCSIYLNFIVGDNVTIIQKHMHLTPQNQSKGFTEYKGPEETNIYVNTIENTKGLLDETFYQNIQNRIENKTEVHLKDNKGTAKLNKNKKKTNPMRVQLLTDIFEIINNTNTNQTQKELMKDKGAAKNIQLSKQESTNGSKSTEENIQDNVYSNIHECTTSNLEKVSGIVHPNIYSEDLKKSTVTRTSSTPASLVDTTVPVTSNLLLNSETTLFTKQAQANISSSISTEKPFYLTERSPTVCLPSNFTQGQLKESTSSDCEDGLNQAEVGSPITFFPTEDCTANLQVKQLIKTSKSFDDSDYDDVDTSDLELGTPITFFPPGCNGNIPTRQSGFVPNVLFQQNVASDNSKHE